MYQKVSVILPIYNEDESAGYVFDSVLNFSKKNPNYDFIFVNDGSTDSTKKILQERLIESKPQRIKLVSLNMNMGKGYAIRKGVEKAEGDHICFTDGDLAYPLSYLKEFSKRLEKDDVVMGWRAPFAENLHNMTAIRKIAGKTFNFLSRNLLGLSYPDMQAGIKGFRKKAAKHLFSINKVNGWSFDTEIIYLAKKKGYKISELPVKVSKSNLEVKSQVKLVRDSLSMFFSLLKIRINDFSGKYG